MKKIYVNPVVSSSRKKSYHPPVLHTKDLLEKELRKRGHGIQLKRLLKGGFVSQVYEATMDGKPAVVKHTEDLTPFDPTEIFIGKEGHNVDSLVLGLLQNSKYVRVPKVYLHLPDITTTVMEDIRHAGFRLMIDDILNKSFSLTSATSVGQTLAHLAQETQAWKKFRTNLSAEQNAYERGLELRLAYPNTQKEYLALEKEFTGNNQYFTWLDGHPKNLFVNDQGEVAIIDFGNSSFADQRYMLPNFLAHITLYGLAGYIPLTDAKQYIQTCVDAFHTIEPVDKKLFCQYLAMEVLHRANGKWINGIDTAKQKVRLYHFGLNIFDESVNTIEDLSMLLLFSSSN